MEVCLFIKGLLNKLSAKSNILESFTFSCYNINAYQGLIFSLGLFLVNLGKALKDKLTLDDVYENIKEMSKCFIHEGNFGARKQAAEGYKSLTQGQKVSFDIIEEETKTRASNITVVE